MTFTPCRPTNPYIVTRSLSTNRGDIIGVDPSDVHGGIFVMLQAEPTLRLIVDGFVNNKMVIAFARQQGGTDVKVPIETSVEDTASGGLQRKRSPKAGLEFTECVQQLIKNIM